MKKTISTVAFTSFQMNYIDLPGAYPILPLCESAYQPAAYTQGNTKHIYVAVAIPVEGQQVIVIPDCIAVEISETNDIFYVCNLSVTTDEGIVSSPRLALLGFSIALPENDNWLHTWKIIMNGQGTKPGDSTLGKVVMDSNILPTGN